MYQDCAIIKDHKGYTLYFDERLECDSFNDTSFNMCFNRVSLMIEKERFIYFIIVKESNTYKRWSKLSKTTNDVLKEIILFI